LIALSFRGLGIIFELDLEHQKLLHSLGLHLGLLFQLVDDILDVSGDSFLIKKPAYKDIKEGVINSHIIYELNGKNKDFDAAIS